MDGSINIAVLTNDDFGDGPSSSAITIFAQASNGTATVIDNLTPTDPTDDTIDYAPDPGFADTDNFTYQICDVDSQCDTAIVTVTVQEQASVFYLSSNTSGTVGSVAFKDEDIVALDTSTGQWSMYFDGSDVGLDASSQEIDALHIEPNGDILLSLGAAGTIPDVGAVDDFDIVRFIPTNLGDFTSGTYELYFDGEDVGLTGEDIDSIGFAPNGDLVISLRGSFSVTGASGGDEDLLIFSNGSFGPNTSGDWALYFDGSVVGLNDTSSEDINATWIDSNGDILMSVRGAFSVTGVVGDGADIFTCESPSGSPITSCAHNLFWDGSLTDFAGEVINALYLGQ
jgi:hypothetical protein